MNFIGNICTTFPFALVYMPIIRLTKVNLNISSYLILIIMRHFIFSQAIV